MIKVVGDMKIERKAGTTTSDKKLKDVNDSDADQADNGIEQTSSDYDIGDMVPYVVTATISEKVGNYKKYHITFEDTLEEGKFDSISELAISGPVAETEDYTVTKTFEKEPSKDGFTVTFTYEPKEGKTLESLAGETIKIEFSAELGKNAAIGAEGNRNTLVVKYSNNPNSTDDKDEGTTPKKVVITFTYKVVVDKVDQDGEELPGAGFTLYKVSKADAEAGVEGADADAKNKAWAGKAIQTWTVDAGGEKGNQFSFEGIDDGCYVLCETTVPDGYNPLDPQVFTVTASHDGVELKSLSGDKVSVSGTIEFKADTAAGSLSATIQNQKGVKLPQTGGMGTTILYALGGILVLGAGILLVARKRMNDR